MNRLLQDLRIVEISAFVAAPLGGMTMAQLGAEVIRIDPIGGGIDYRRWPVTKDGASLYWAGLNKGKRSVALALDKPEGREIARALVAAPGPGAGILLTNLPPLRGLDFASLKAARADAIMLRLVGNRDGRAAVDYTVNAASGFPLVTGEGGGAPVNHVLPAWDIAAGLYLATGAARGRAPSQPHRRGPGGRRRARRCDARRRSAISAMSATSDQRAGAAGARQRSLRQLRPRFRHRRRAPGHDHRADPAAMAGLGQATGLAEKLAMIGTRDGGRSRHRGRAL